MVLILFSLTGSVRKQRFYCSWWS